LDLQVVFFFAGDLAFEDNGMTNTKTNVGEEKFIWTKIKLSLKDIIDQGKALSDQRLYIMKQGAEKMASGLYPHDGQCWYIPKAWFQAPQIQNKPGKKENWNGYITIVTDNTFKKFGILNVKKKVYLAFHQYES